MQSGESRAVSHLPSGLPEVVGREEDIARFVTSSSHFNTDGVKPIAFEPGRNDGQTSVFRHGSQPQDELWEIAEAHMPNVRKIYGAAIFKARQVFSAGLNLTASEPPPLHANISGWTWTASDPENGKSARMMQAQLIVQNAEFIRT